MGRERSERGRSPRNYGEECLGMTVLVGTEDGYHVYTSSGEHVHALAGHGVEALTPVGDGTWLAVVDGTDVWRHFLDGSWAPVATGTSRLTALAVCGEIGR